MKIFRSMIWKSALKCNHKSLEIKVTLRIGTRFRQSWPKLINISKWNIEDLLSTDIFQILSFDGSFWRRKYHFSKQILEKIHTKLRSTSYFFYGNSFLYVFESKFARFRFWRVHNKFWKAYEVFMDWYREKT